MNFCSGFSVSILISIVMVLRGSSMFKEIYKRNGGYQEGSLRKVQPTELDLHWAAPSITLHV